MTFLENLSWRFATKQFDRERRVSKSDLDSILKAIQYAPSSRGLQPFHVFVVADQYLKNQLRSAAHDQPQVSDCSYLLVFCTRLDLVKRVEDYLAINHELNQPNFEKTESLKKSMLATVKKLDKTKQFVWARRQTYIALGFGLAACAELKIDSCPMEGFDAEPLGKVLDLPDYMRAVVLLAVGSRKQEPARNKIRFPKTDLFTHR